MPFNLGPGSLRELEGVHPDLVAVVRRAIEITAQDFGVHDGSRTIEEQRELVRKGASQTMDSNHLVQADGLGHAVDLVPYINGQLRWEWGPIYEIAEAMRRASADLGISLVWGGVWDRTLGTYGNGAEAMKAAVQAYEVRHPGRDFIDGPHYQLA